MSEEAEEFGQSTPGYLSPSAIGEYISQNKCSRYAKHVFQDIDESVSYAGSDFDEGFNPLNILLSRAGKVFEEDVFDASAPVAREVTEFNESDSEEFYQNHTEIVDTVERAVTAEDAWVNDPILLYQPGLSGAINAWGIQGDADLIYVWSTEDGAEVRIVDIKRTSDEKIYQQIQTATYVDLLANLIRESGLECTPAFGGGERDGRTPTDASNESAASDVGNDPVLRLSGGVITWESDVTPLTRDIVPSFGVESRIMDIRRLLQDDGPISTALEKDLNDAPHQIDSKCSQCPYNEGCVTDAFAQNHPRLLGLSVSKQRQLETVPDEPIDSVSKLADVGRATVDQWKPTEYETLSMGGQTHRQLESTIGIGEEFTQLVYEAKGLQDMFSPENDGVSDRSRNWLPGSGECELPDDDPDEASGFTREYKRGSMVRVYLNIQQDHLRDRAIQMSARVTATASSADPQRVSMLSSGASDDREQATQDERELLTAFTRDLFSAIKEVAAGVDLDDAAVDNPPLHFYTYTDTELEALTEAFDRHDDCEPIQAVRDAIEGGDRPDDQMVSTLRSEVSQHIILETPSPGLIPAHDELHPPAESYSKPSAMEAWEYSPPDSDHKYDIRRVFGRRLFDVGVAYEQQADEIRPDPTTWDPVDGVNTRVRFDAAIPLGYLWAATDRIDEDWKERVDDSLLAEQELNTYLYRAGGDHNEEIQPLDLRELGRHMCDMLEHVERSLTHKDALIEKAPFPMDSLETDTFAPPSLATGAMRYLQEEYDANRKEKYELYRRFERQRIIAGDSIPVKVEDIERVSYNTIRVDGSLSYHRVFAANAEKIRSACSQTGSEGTSSGSWMVANEFIPTTTTSELTKPHEIEKGANATVERLAPTQNSITFTLRNFGGDSSDFGQQHRGWSLDPEAKADERKLYLEEGTDLILDPQTDDIISEWTYDALQFAAENGLHDRLEAVRSGAEERPKTALFNSEVSNAEWIGEDTERPVAALDAFAEWLSREVGADTYPSEEQQTFITNGDAQFLCLQGPPGTGKTAATMGPSLLARACGAAEAGESLNVLVTAPSNTAIDELLEDTADRLQDAEQPGGPFASGVDIELVRVGSKSGDAPEDVTYANYNDDDHTDRIQRICDRLKADTHTHSTGAETSQSETRGEEGQASLGAFGSSRSGATPADQSSQGSSSGPITIVFATVPGSWQFLKEIAPSSRPDTEEVVEQSIWDVIAVDEASMLELPDLLHAGIAFRPHGQMLVAGDHRQLPPVQKDDWDEVRRRDLRSTAAYLSTLDYLRLLRGVDVLDDEQLAGFECGCDHSAVEIPLVQLETTYRFDDRVASLMQRTIYSKDGIPYESALEPGSYEAAKETPAAVDSIFSSESSVALITYDPTEYHQQWNPIESIITQSLVQYTTPETTIGVVTPHNAHRGHLTSKLPQTSGGEVSQGWREIPPRDAQIETVNRFQGGERDVMILNATVSDPAYIDSESEFLLQENRINVSLTRHSELLIVTVPESILGYMPSDPDLYGEAAIWKVLAADLGEAPTVDTDPDWTGELGEFLKQTGWTPETVPKNPFVSDQLLPSSMSVYTI